MDGLQLLKKLNELNQTFSVVVLTAQGSIERAVEAMKMGAYDFIQKACVDPTRLRNILANACRQRDTERELEVTRVICHTGILGSLGGASRKMQETYAMIERVAPSNVSVLITGESGPARNW